MVGLWQPDQADEFDSISGILEKKKTPREPNIGRDH